MLEQDRFDQEISLLPHIEVAFIDCGIPDLPVLVANLRPEVRAVVLPAEADPVSAIARTLRARRNLAAIHIVAHGAPGELRFGAGPLNEASVHDRGEELAAIGAALEPGGELRLWSCQVGEGEPGERLREGLAAATGVRIAAARGLVGAASAGGTWRLGGHGGGGTSSSEAPLTMNGQAVYAGVLTTFTGTSLNDIADAPGGVLVGFSGGTLTQLQDSTGDSITGGAGNDLIRSGPGDDTINGVLADPDHTDTLDGGAGNDRLVVNGTGPFFEFGLDTTDADLTGIEIIDATTTADPAIFFYDQTEDFIILGPLINGPFSTSTLIGGSGNDTIIGGFGVDRISGSNGNDSISGRSGNDIISGGNDDDIIVGFEGADTVYGDSGTDTLRITATSTDLNSASDAQLTEVEIIDGPGGAGGAVLFNLTNQSEGLTIRGGIGNDTIISGNAADYIAADDGANSISGGGGNDSISGFRFDTVDGGAGIGDRLLLTPGTFGNLRFASDAQLTAVEIIDGRVLDRGPSEINVASQSENLTILAPSFIRTTIIGGSGSDTITGGFEVEVITGGNGNDSISSGGANDTITGGAGNDIIDGGIQSTADTANYSGNRSDYSVSLSGTTFTLFDTRAGSPDGTDTVTNVETFLFADGPIAAGSLDVIPPTVTAVAYGSNAGTLKAGDSVTLLVTLSEIVNVTGGTPSLGLNSNGTATLSGGSGTTTLTFTYKVAAGENTSDLAVTAFNLNGATVKDVQGNNADTAGALINPTGVLVVDTVAPAIPTIDGFAEDTAPIGDRTTTDNTLTVNGTAEPVSTVTLFDGSTNLGTATALADGTWSVVTTALSPGDHPFTASATDAAGNASQPSDALIVKVESGTPPPPAPTVATVALTGANGIQNSTLNAGDTVSTTVSFSSAVNVTGTPQLGLTIGATTVQATYASGSGTNDLVFTYTILAAQNDDDGISIAANSLSLNGGSINDASTANGAVLGHPAVADNSGFLVDTVAPAIPTIDGFAEDTGTIGDGITTDNTLTVNGTAEPVSTVTLFDGSTNLGTATALAGGTWSFDTAALSPGDHSFTASATDAAGNESGPSPSLVVSIQSAGPPPPTDQSDVITGTEASEVISGIPQDSVLRGRGSIDILTGNGGNDRFLLGDTQGSYYDDNNNALAGNNDFAYITDFAAGDKIQLYGRPQDYVLGSGRFERGSPRATIIYSKNPDRPGINTPPRPWSRDEWIGMVLTSDPNTTLNLNDPNQFTFLTAV